MKSLLHLTINTGHAHLSPRTEVEEVTIDALMTLIEHGGGSLAPFLPGFTIQVIKAERGWVFTIFSPREAPVVSCGVAADKASADKLWPSISKPMLEPPLMPPSFEVSQPTHLPWIAAQLLISDATKEEFYDIGSFERFFAWALIEHPEVKQ